MTETNDLPSPMAWLKRRWFIIGPALGLVSTLSLVGITDHLAIKENTADAAELKKHVDKLSKLHMAMFLNITMLCDQSSVKCVTLDDIENGNFKLPKLEKK